MSEHAESASASDEKPTATNRPVPPPSRQSLVVKPRASNGPLLVCGAIASAAAGFAVVFASGLGRTNQDVAAESSPRFFAPAATDQAAKIEPVPLERPRPGRFEATPAAVEAVADDTAPAAAPAGFSRFSDVASDPLPETAAEPVAQTESAEGDGVAEAADEPGPLLIAPEGREGPPDGRDGPDRKSVV